MRGKWQFELSVMHYTKYPPAARELQTLPKTRLLFTRAIEEKFAILPNWNFTPHSIHCCSGAEEVFHSANNIQ